MLRRGKTQERLERHHQNFSPRQILKKGCPISKILVHVFFFLTCKHHSHTFVTLPKNWSVYLFVACRLLIECLTFNSLIKLCLKEPQVLNCVKNPFSQWREWEHYQVKFETKCDHLLSSSLKTRETVLGAANNIPMAQDWISLMPHFTLYSYPEVPTAEIQNNLTSFPTLTTAWFLKAYSTCFN